MISIPGQGTKILHATRQLSQNTTTIALALLNEGARMPKTTEPTCPGACEPQLERENLHTAMKRPRAVMKDPAGLNEEPVCHN